MMSVTISAVISMRFPPSLKKGQQHAYQRESRTRASGLVVNFALFGHLGAGYRRTLTSWAEAFYPPARTVGGDVSEAGTGVSRRGGIAKGRRRVSASYCSDAYRQQACQARRPFARLFSGPEKTALVRGRSRSLLRLARRKSTWPVIVTVPRAMEVKHRLLRARGRLLWNGCACI